MRLRAPSGGKSRARFARRGPSAQKAPGLWEALLLYALPLCVVHARSVARLLARYAGALSREPCETRPTGAVGHCVRGARSGEQATSSHTPGSSPLPCLRSLVLRASISRLVCLVPPGSNRRLSALPSASYRQPECAHAGDTTPYQDADRGSYEGRARTNPAGAGQAQRCPAASEPR